MDQSEVTWNAERTAYGVGENKRKKRDMTDYVKKPMI